MGLIKNHLKKMAKNAIGGKLGSLLDGAFNDKISGSAVSLGKNFAKLKEQANYVFEENEYSFGSLSFPRNIKVTTRILYIVHYGRESVWYILILILVSYLGLAKNLSYLILTQSLNKDAGIILIF